MTGPTFLVTRPAHQARRTAALLAGLGARAIVSPLLTIAPQPIGEWMDADGIVATSANAFNAVGPEADRLRRLPVYAIGPRTSAAALEAGFEKLAYVGNADRDYLSAALVDAHLTPGGPRRLIYLAGDVRSGDPTAGFRDAGGQVQLVEVYRTDAADAFTTEAQAALRAGRIDHVLLYSPRTAAIFRDRLDALGVAPSGVALACLSQAVAEAAGAGPWKAVATAGWPSEPFLFSAAGLLCQKHDGSGPDDRPPIDDDPSGESE